MIFGSKVRLTPRVSYEILEAQAFDNTDVLAECRFETKQIVLLASMTLEEKIKSLIHELLHAIEHEYKIQIPHKAIYGLEHAIVKVMRLNGWLPKKRKTK